MIDTKIHTRNTKNRAVPAKYQNRSRIVKVKTI